MSILDMVKEGKTPTPKKVAKAWTIETGRSGAQTQINTWVGTKTGKNCDGSGFTPELNDKGKPKRVTNICFEVDGAWYIKIPYGTKTLLQGGISAKNQADAIDVAKQAYKDIGDGLLDDRIKKAYEESKADRKK